RRGCPLSDPGAPTAGPRGARLPRPRRSRGDGAACGRGAVPAALRGARRRGRRARLPRTRAGGRMRPTPILFVHHRSELGGAPASLSYLIRELDRDRFEPHVYCPPGPAAELFREAGAVVHTGEVAAFTHIWASTYSGRRWLLLARELARLPS